MKNAVITGTAGFIGGNLYNKIKDDFNILPIEENIFDDEEWRDNLICQ